VFKQFKRIVVCYTSQDVPVSVNLRILLFGYKLIYPIQKDRQRLKTF